MKLPKNFGGQGLGMIKQAQEAMERAKNLEAELEKERIVVDKGPVQGVFTGAGDMVSFKVSDTSLLDPESAEDLEDLVVACVREGFAKATALRGAKVQEIMPNLPGMPGF
jgi:DNA-binding protein YbaB